MSYEVAGTGPSQIKVSVVIVVWNAQKYVAQCLQSLKRECPCSNLEVIIVDNASTDGAPEFVQKDYPEIKLIRNSENFGFAKANNIGIAASTGDVICLINSDVEFTQNCFDPMLRYLSAHPDVGMLGPKMIGPNGHVARLTLRFPTVWNMFCRAMGLDLLFKKSIFGDQLMRDFGHQSTADVEVLTGWFWMIPRRALETVGPLDEQFFMYGEDVDWCYRFHRAGKRVVFFAGAEALHYGGASSATAPIRFFVEKQRANIQFGRKHYGILRRLGLFVTGLLYHFVRVVGYGFVWLIKPSQRESAVAKYRRSAICLHWLIKAPI
jgi:GT2 family glycosyltransferase